MPDQPEAEFDVVIAGSGAAGMTAALACAKQGLDVVVVEKAEHFGGSTARSGGGVWVPNNEALRNAGIEDSPERARDYLDAIVGDVVPRERREAYLRTGPEVVSFVHRNTPLRLRWVRDYSDYHPEQPGGRPRGRSVEPRPLDGRELGDQLGNLEPPYSQPPLGMPMNQVDYRWISLLARHPKGTLQMFQLGGRWLAGLLRGRKTQLSMGQALAAGLRAGLLRAGVPVWLQTPVVDIEESDGRVTGVVVERDGERQRIRARRGVILGSGGFEHNAEMRAKYQRQPIGTEWTVGAKANTGDGIRAGQEHGAALDLMDDSWWGPTIPLPGGPWFALAERSRPGTIMVNDRGKRFFNESTPYVEAVHAMYGGAHGQGDGPAENIPTWLIFDQRNRNRYMFTGLGPRQAMPGRWFKHGIAAKAENISELAEKIGVPADALRNTVQRFNSFAEKGVDEDFRRGDSAYDHYYGDPRNQPNPSLGPLDTGPYYAVKIVPGDLGTKGGLVTDSDARVLREDGSIIEGLYAAGNTSSAVMGHTYAGPGATIGPAMVFGYRAAQHLATGEPSQDHTANDPVADENESVTAEHAPGGKS